MGDVLELDKQTLLEIMPSVQDACRWAALLNDCLKYAEANTVPRGAALLAQIAHESGECRYLIELADGKAYERRQDLGNTEPGDGPRYKGRGLIQLTGRDNYRRAGQHIGLNLELHPDEAQKPTVAVQVCAWFWTSRDLNKLADVYDFVAVTQRINGGIHHLDRRLKYYLRALNALAVKQRSES